MTRLRRSAEPWLFIIRDELRGLALVFGRGAHEAIETLHDVGGTYAEMTALWSRDRDGWVIPLRFAGDVEAYGRSKWWRVVVQDRRPGQGMARSPPRLVRNPEDSRTSPQG